MTKKEFLSKIKEEHSDLTLAKLGSIMDTMFNVIDSAVEQGDYVNIPGHRFKKYTRPERRFRNIKTGELFSSPARDYVCMKKRIGGVDDVLDEGSAVV